MVAFTLLLLTIFLFLFTPSSFFSIIFISFLYLLERKSLEWKIIPAILFSCPLRSKLPYTLEATTKKSMQENGMIIKFAGRRKLLKEKGFKCFHVLKYSPALVLLVSRGFVRIIAKIRLLQSTVVYIVYFMLLNFPMIKNCF